MVYGDRMAIAEPDTGPSVHPSIRAGRAVADAVIMRALSDVARRKAPDYATAVEFFEGGMYRLYADVLGLEYEYVYAEYEAVKSGEKAIVPIGNNSPMSEQEVIRARELAKQGLNNVEVAEKLNRSESTIGRLTRDITAARKRTVTPDEHNRIRRLYRQGYSLKDIEARTGWSWYTVCKRTEDLRANRVR